MYATVKKIGAIVLALLFCAPAIAAAAGSASSVFRDSSGFIRPLILTDFVKANYFTATSTTASSTLPKLSSTIFGATTVCISGDCKSAWPSSGGGGSGTISTSSALVAPQILYATGVSTAASAATSTLTGTANQISVSNSPFIIGASGAVLSFPSLLILPPASTTIFSAGTAFFGATATSSFSTAGVLTLASALTVPNGGTGAATLTGVLLGNGTSAFTAASTQTCTNQFVRAMSSTYSATCATVGAADVSLANLSATDSTLTFSGTYTGATARTIGLNLGNGNTWTALQKFSNASSTIESCTGPCYFGATATSSFSTAGVLTLVSALTVGNGGTGQTTFTSGNLLYGVGTGAVQSVATSTSGTASTVMFLDSSQHVTIPNASTTALSINGDTTTGKRYLTFTYATSTAWTGTTTLLQLGIAPIGFTFSAAQCATDAGTLNIQYQYGTGPTLVLPMIPASTTVGTTNFTSNNTPVSPNVVGVKAGTPASSPTTVTCTVTAKQT